MNIVLFYLLSIFLSGPIIKVDKDIHNYGIIERGSNGDCKFLITNIGNEPLIIDTVFSNCNCSIIKYPKRPILPGESRKIYISYNTDRPGAINRKITIVSNSGEYFLYIKGMVRHD
jgi:hypothetical protein